jgi:hypothetical protein
MTCWHVQEATTERKLTTIWAPGWRASCRHSCPPKDKAHGLDLERARARTRARHIRPWVIVTGETMIATIATSHLQGLVTLAQIHTMIMDTIPMLMTCRYDTETIEDCGDLPAEQIHLEPRGHTCPRSVCRCDLGWPTVKDNQELSEVSRRRVLLIPIGTAQAHLLPWIWAQLARSSSPATSSILQRQLRPRLSYP